MISEFERLVRKKPLQPCFIFCEEDGTQKSYDFETLRLRAASLVGALHERGVQRGDYISIDMENCPEFIVAILAACYSGVTLVALNHRLTDAEKKERIQDIKLIQGVHLEVHLDEEFIAELLSKVNSSIWQGIHIAERADSLFNQEAPALVLFTSGTTGIPKAVSLSWKNLCGSARASNRVLSSFRKSVWQLTLPLFHVGGFQIFVRSILNETPFLLYRHFDAEKILADASKFQASHISVVDKMLSDLIVADGGSLRNYECVLLGGAAPNPVILEKAAERNTNLYVSYGMTETSSLVAASFLTPDFDGSLSLLPGYRAQVVSPDKEGVGQLAISGPGVFSKYLNAQAEFTPEGFFLTGDQASKEKDHITVKERLGDMFVSGGENIYPEEIRVKLMRAEGVREAYVFGADDATWGKRPIAFVERSDLDGAQKELNPSSNFAFADYMEGYCDEWLSKLYLPRHLFVRHSFPRSSVGKVHTKGLQELYEQRIEVKEVRLHRVKQELTHPFAGAKTEFSTRESLVLEVIDQAGRVGIGECVAFPTSWYMPETLDYDLRVLEEQLIPLITETAFLHPREVASYFDWKCDPEAPMARGALEPALWDLYGKIANKPLWKLLLEEYPADIPQNGSTIEVAAGLVLGIMPIEDTLKLITEEMKEGYRRVKLKIKPGDDIERVLAVREAFPDIELLLDANQSYTEDDIDLFELFNALNVRCIEEPLAPQSQNRSDLPEFYARLSELQKQIEIPICLDESIQCAEDAYLALDTPWLRCFALKVGKWGGITPALEFCRKAEKAGAQVWMGGMYETAISKRVHAAFEVLPGVSIPGDISSTSRYFKTEITNPPFEVKKGNVILNEPGYEQGIGCKLNYEVLDQVKI